MDAIKQITLTYGQKDDGTYLLIINNTSDATMEELEEIMDILKGHIEVTKAEKETAVLVDDIIFTEDVTIQ